MHGNEWRGAYQRLHESSPSPSHPASAVPSVTNGAGFSPQQWLRVDVLGNVNAVQVVMKSLAVQVDKQHLVQELSIPFRDLRTLDPSLRIPYPIALFVRLKAIIVNFEALRMIITHDQAFVLSVPVPGESLLVGQAAKPQGTFVKHLRLCIRGHAAQCSTPSSDTDSSITQPVGVEHAQLPFELRCLEAALDTALPVMGGETSALELHTSPLFSRASQKVERGELELLRDSRSALSKLTNRVTKLKQELETVLGSESEMEMLYLGRRIASQEPAQQPAQTPDEQQRSPPQQEGDAPQPGPRRSSRPSHAASAPPVAEPEDSEDDAEAVPTANEDAEEPHRQHSAEGGQPRRRSQHDSFKHSVRQVTRMLSTLHTMHSLQQSTLQSDKSTWALANLLDSNLMHCEHLLQRLEVLKDHLLSVEKFISAELDHRRNELVSLDIFVTALMSMFAFVSMIGGIFGMNLTNGFEASHVVFLLATWGSLAGAALIFGSIMWFAWSKHLLLIPDTSSVARDVD